MFQDGASREEIVVSSTRQGEGECPRPGDSLAFGSAGYLPTVTTGTKPP